MAKRLNDTAAVKGLPPGGDSTHESHSVSVRRIENGYIVSESHCKDNQYSSTERFSAEKPNVELEPTGTGASGALRDAVKSIRG